MAHVVEGGPCDEGGNGRAFVASAMVQAAKSVVAATEPEREACNGEET